MAQKIFIVEDDAVIAKTISDYLNRWAFAVSTVTKFDQVDAEISAAAPDLVIMDISLPYFNGFHWLSELRKQVVALTPTETKLLSLLFSADGEVVSREAMIEKLWEGDDFIDRNALAVNMNRLRKKVTSFGLAQLIETVKGKGYRLASEGPKP